MEDSLSKITVREIRAEMGRQHISQRELADRLEWTQSQLSRRLSGAVRLSMDDVEAIANELNVGILQLTVPRARV